MTPSDATRWCPHCRRPTQTAPLPQLAEDVAMFGPLPGTDDPQAFRRKLYCTQCTAIWDSLELPSEFVKNLLAARQSLEETQRQMAMLKLLAARQRQAEQQPQRRTEQQHSEPQRPTSADRPALRLAG